MIKERKKRMGVYIGYVDRKGYEPTIFFNFKPIAEITESQITVLSDSALDADCA